MQGDRDHKVRNARLLQKVGEGRVADYLSPLPEENNALGFYTA